MKKHTGIVEIYRGSGNRWRFRVKGLNGEIVVPPEEYGMGKPGQKRARRGVRTLARIMKNPKVIVLKEPMYRRPRRR